MNSVAPVEARNRVRPLLFVVEGNHDIAFLKTISATLSAEDRSLPDLEFLERSSLLVFVPQGGGDLLASARRFAPLGLCEFHLYDREIDGETKRREAACRRVNAVPGCQAALTSKRALENYLHPACIREVLGIDLDMNDAMHVPDTVAGRLWKQRNKPIAWEDVPVRSRRRHRERVKRALNSEAVRLMTPALLGERDPRGDVVGWLTIVAQLLSLQLRPSHLNHQPKDHLCRFCF